MTCLQLTESTNMDRDARTGCLAEKLLIITMLFTRIFIVTVIVISDLDIVCMIAQDRYIIIFHILDRILCNSHTW